MQVGCTSGTPWIMMKLRGQHRWLLWWVDVNWVVSMACNDHQFSSACRRAISFRYIDTWQSDAFSAHFHWHIVKMSLNNDHFKLKCNKINYRYTWNSHWCIKKSDWLHCIASFTKPNPLKLSSSSKCYINIYEFGSKWSKLREID